MAEEPVPCQVGHLLQRSWFLEQVRCARNDHQSALAAQFPHGPAVEVDDEGVAFPDDQQGGLAHLAQARAREVGSAPAGDDGLHGGRPVAAAMGADAAPVPGPE
jgi:hypothetical protein